MATYPVPPGRGRWRLSLHNRAFSPGLTLRDTATNEIVNARSIQLVQALSKPAVLTFALSGFASTAPLIKELVTDIVAWRWNSQTGQDVPLFRGIVAQSQDTLSEQANTVTFTCHDYLDMLNRRILTANLNYAQADQDTIATGIVEAGKTVSTSGRVSLNPGAYLPIVPHRVDPSGAARGLSGTLRDRQYVGQQVLSEALDNLANVQGGFDYDVIPALAAGLADGPDSLRLFFPSQGVLRTDLILEYGSTVKGLSRSINSADYANYLRVIGNNGSSDPAAAQLYAEAWNNDANNVTVSPSGLWMAGDNASDVTLVQTLRDQANGELATQGLLSPSYSLDLRPSFYSYGNPKMGDVCRLLINAGRLNVDTDIRVIGITYDVGDDGQEDVSLQVGRADVKFSALFTKSARDINALARR
jgi:hypothetical protein